MEQGEVWVYIEHEQGEVARPSLGLIYEARKVATALERRLAAVLLGAGLEQHTETIQAYGVDAIWLGRASEDCFRRPDQSAGHLAQLVTDRSPSVVLFAETATGREVAARLAAKLGLPLAASCVSLKVNDGRVSLLRSVLSGQAHSLVETSGWPLVATMRLEVLGTGQRTTKKTGMDVQTVDLPSANLPEIEVLAFHRADPQTVDLSDADVVVAAGKGVQSAAGFEQATEFARLIGGSIGGTRPVRDAGWIDLNRQIGQTGKTVTPRFLIALGVSGASQFTIGIKDASFIVAINTDQHARIFSVADVAIQGDASAILTAASERLRQLQVASEKAEGHPIAEAGKES